MDYYVQGAPSFAGLIETKDLFEEPNIYAKSITCQQHKQWEKAMQNIYKSLLRNKTWTLIYLLMGQKAIKCEWVYHIKTNAQGEIYKCKVRVIAKGFFQTFNIHYIDIFSLVVKHDSL